MLVSLRRFANWVVQSVWIQWTGPGISAGPTTGLNIRPGFVLRIGSRGYLATALIGLSKSW